MKKVDLDEPWLNWQITSKTTFYLCLLKQIVIAHFQSLFERSNRDAFWETEGKMHEGECVKEVFFHKPVG